MDGAASFVTVRGLSVLVAFGDKDYRSTRWHGWGDRRLDDHSITQYEF